MGEVNLTINGKSYGVACDDGQEERVLYLGQHLDQRVTEIAGAGAASTDAHLLVLASLIMADEIHELREMVQNMVPADGSAPKPMPQRVSAEQEQHIIKAIDHLAQRIDKVTSRLDVTSKAA